MSLDILSREQGGYWSEEGDRNTEGRAVREGLGPQSLATQTGTFLSLQMTPYQMVWVWPALLIISSVAVML